MMAPLTPDPTTSASYKVWAAVAWSISTGTVGLSGWALDEMGFGDKLSAVKSRMEWGAYTAGAARCVYGDRVNPLLYQLNTRLLRFGQGLKVGRLATLDDLPDALLDNVPARSGNPTDDACVLSGWQVEDGAPLRWLVPINLGDRQTAHGLSLDLPSRSWNSVEIS
jgi:hypothetical protein